MAIWSDLPPELAGLILCRLLSHDDRPCFGSVCRQWRLAAQQPLPPALPWLCSFEGDFFQSLPGGELKTFPAYCLGCFDNWLFCEHKDGTSACFLINPSSRKTIEIPECPFPKWYDDDDEFPYPRNMIVCSPNLVAGMRGIGSVVAFYRPGDISWSLCPPDTRGWWYVDIAFFQGKLYALTMNEELVVVHDLVEDSKAGKPKAWHVEHAIKDGAPVTNRLDEIYYASNYLVVSCGNLLMVRIGGSRDKLLEKVTLKVFKADLIAGRWSEVKNLDGGQALFVGRCCSKSLLLPDDDDRFKGNRVYFIGTDLALSCPDTRQEIPTYCFSELGNGSISHVFLQRKGNTRLFDSWRWFFHCS